MKFAKSTDKTLSMSVGKWLLAGLVLAGLWGCSRSEQSPGYEFMPDMYRSQSYKPYSASPVFKDGISARKPPVGAVAIGQTPFNYKNTPEDYERSAELKSPITENAKNKEEGKKLFLDFCSHCHGANGDGVGQIVKLELFPQIPSFQNQLKTLPEGKMFFSITYGKGLMGSHASQLSPDERWLIVQYIKELQTK